MVVRTLEAIFHRPLRLLILFMLPLLMGVGIVYFEVPHTYKSTATLWAMHGFEIIGLTATNSNPLPIPAESQANALSELLQTRAFALRVAQEANLASTLAQSVQSDSQRRDDAMFLEISQHVSVQAQGNNLFGIAYANRNPQVAQQVVAAVIRNYSEKIPELFLVQVQNLLSSYQEQLATARQNEQAAVAAEFKYLKANPDLTNPNNLNGNNLQNDPNYAHLHDLTQQAAITEQDIQKRLGDIEQEIRAQGVTITAQGVTLDSFFKVVDNPVAASLPESRSRDLIMAGGIGLLVAIIACALYIVILVRRDRAVYTARDLQKVTNYPVIMLVPRLTSRTVPLLIKEIDIA
jgi:hypothetical protein